MRLAFRVRSPLWRDDVPRTCEVLPSVTGTFAQSRKLRRAGSRLAEVLDLRRLVDADANLVVHDGDAGGVGRGAFDSVTFSPRIHRPGEPDAIPSHLYLDGVGIDRRVPV